MVTREPTYHFRPVIESVYLKGKSVCTADTGWGHTVYTCIATKKWKLTDDPWAVGHQVGILFSPRWEKREYYEAYRKSYVDKIQAQ